MKIVLLGYMGSGKSAISKALSSRLNLQRIDLDDFIKEKEGCTIPEIFKSKGEIYFRKLETTCLEELLSNDRNFILSLGGGTPCFGSNMDLVLQSSISIYLKASVPTLVNRLMKEKGHRPVIAHLSDEELPEFIAKHLFERSAYYLKSEFKVAVDDKSVEMIADDIMSIIQK